MVSEEIAISVNGDRMRVARGASVADVLQAMDVDPENARGIAVAVDHQVVSRDQWRSTRITEDTSVEVITATQGG